VKRIRRHSPDKATRVGGEDLQAGKVVKLGVKQRDRLGNVSLNFEVWEKGRETDWAAIDEPTASGIGIIC
jgi:hypothetical protein